VYIDYLTWYKDVEIELHSRSDAHHVLISSSVCEPTHMLEQDIRASLDDDFARHIAIPDSWGYPPLIESISERYGVDRSWIVPTGGVSNSLYLVCSEFLGSRGHVVIETPCYRPLEIVPAMTGAAIGRITRRSPDYSVDPDEVGRVVKAETQLIILSNLHNPTCAHLDDELLIEVADAARSINPQILILVDEVYHDFVTENQKSAALLDSCFISMNSLTKVYGLGSLHVGWIIARPDVAERIAGMFVPVEGSGSRVRDLVASRIVGRLDQYLDRSVKLTNANRGILGSALAELLDRGILEGNVSSVGCTYFPRLRGVDTTDEICRRLAEEDSVYVVPGRFFDAPGHVRIGYGCESEKLKAAVRQFTAGMSNQHRG
jgi:aspartate/methionine/tyrosine aminotransferase